MTKLVRVGVLGIGLGCLAGACGTVSVDPGDDDGGMVPDDDGGDDESAEVGSFRLGSPTERVLVRQGTLASVEVSVERLDGFEGSVTVSVDGLPEGVEAQPIAIAAGEDTGTLNLVAGDEAVQGATSVNLVGEAGSRSALLERRLLVAGKPGTLDQSFGDGGVFIQQVEDRATIGLGLATAANGWIYATGTTGWEAGEAVTIRLQENGAIDESFGEKGAVMTDVGLSAGGTVLLPIEGRVLVGGWCSVADGTDSWATLALFAYDENGDEDEEFGEVEEGVTVTDLGKGFGTAVQQMLVDTRGDLVVIGAHDDADLESTSYFLRYTADGRELGQERPEWKGLWAFAARSLGDGRILMAGADKGDYWLARVGEDGQYDPTFGGGNPVTTDIAGIGDQAMGVVHLPQNDLILVAGTAEPTEGQTLLSLTRYDASGLLDPAFGDGGKLITDIPLRIQAANAAERDDQGTVLVIGAMADRKAANLAVLRIHPDGSRDEGFGENGMAVVEFPDVGVYDLDGARDIAFDDDGRILVTGLVGSNGDESMVVMRLWP